MAVFPAMNFKQAGDICESHPQGLHYPCHPLFKYNDDVR